MALGVVLLVCLTLLSLRFGLTWPAVVFLAGAVVTVVCSRSNPGS